jgi:hypothetical protein
MCGDVVAIPGYCKGAQGVESCCGGVGSYKCPRIGVALERDTHQLWVEQCEASHSELWVELSTVTARDIMLIASDFTPEPFHGPRSTHDETPIDVR